MKSKNNFAQNFTPKRSLSQNFLVDETHLVPMLKGAKLQSGDGVLEIGPGLGILTEKLALEAQNVIAIELDQRLIENLQNHFQSQSHVQIIHGDILEVQLETLFSSPYKVVANLPYSITNVTIRHLLESPHPPELSVLMVQQEVAERICAKPGDLSILAISVQFYTRPKIIHHVPSSAFRPQPKVNSAIIALERLAQPLLPDVDPKFFFRIVRAGFSQKRKQLLNSLSAGLHLEKPVIGESLISLDIDPKRRAQSLSLDEWGKLSKELMGRIT